MGFRPCRGPPGPAPRQRVTDANSRRRTWIVSCNMYGLAHPRRVREWASTAFARLAKKLGHYGVTPVLPFSAVWVRTLRIRAQPSACGDVENRRLPTGPTSRDRAIQSTTGRQASEVNLPQAVFSAAVVCGPRPEQLHAVLRSGALFLPLGLSRRERL